MEIQIRKAKKNDIPLILGLLYELGRPKPEKDQDVDQFRNLIKKYLSDKDKTILLAEADEIHIAGLASLNVLSRLNQTKSELYIPELIITKKYQRKGIGKKILDSCVEFGKKHNCYRVRLESGNIRKNSHKFYLSCGFENNSQSFSKKIN